MGVQLRLQFIDMAVELTPLGKFTVILVKWVLAPVAVAFIGYAVIGPRVGGNVVKKLSGFGSAESASKNAPSARSSANGKRFQEIRGIGN
jgi:hypothetical protein